MRCLIFGIPNIIQNLLLICRLHMYTSRHCKHTFFINYSSLINNGIVLHNFKCMFISAHTLLQSMQNMKSLRLGFILFIFKDIIF
jgi:hypothetical protein